MLYGTTDWHERPTGWLPLGERSPVYGYSARFQAWYVDGILDTNGDGIKSFGDLLRTGAVNGWTFDVESLIEKYTEDYDWLRNDAITASVLASKWAPDQTPDAVGDVDYEGTYELWATLITPIEQWMMDKLYIQVSTNRGSDNAVRTDMME